MFASGVVPGVAPPAPRPPAANPAALPRPAWLSRAAAAASAPGASVSVVLASAAHIEDSTSRSYAAALARFDAAQRPGLAPHVRIVDLDQRQLEPRVLAFMDALAAASATGKFGGAVALFASALRHALELAGRPEANPFLLTRVAWRKRALCKLSRKRCRVCGDDLQDVVDSENNKKRARPAGAACRDLKRCSRTSCSSLLDRDANVSRGTEGGEEGGEEGGGGEEVPILTPPHTTHPADHTQAGLSLLQKTLCRVRGIEEPKHLRRDFVRETETTRTPHGSERTRAGCSTFFLTARRKISA